MLRMPSRRVSISAVIAAVLVTPTAAISVAEDQPAPIETSTWAHDVAPGVRAEEHETYSERGWQVTNALTVDMTKGAEVGYLTAGSLTDLAPVTEQAEQAGAVAAVNGDFFDIDNSGSPIGPVVSNGTLLKSPSGDHTRIVAFDDEGKGRVTDLVFSGLVSSGQRPDMPLDRLNSSDLPDNGIGAYTSAWGEYSRTRAVLDAATVTEVTIADGVVTGVSDKPGEGSIPEGTTILVGRENGSALLDELAVGDPVTVDWAATAADGRPIDTAIGSHALLVDNGEPQPVNDELNAARTAIGFSADGTEMVVLSADGDNQSHSRGATLAEMAQLMADRGVESAVEIDGGGSSTMLSRRPGADAVEVDNTPSDGELRKVPNGLGIFAPDGSGQTDGLRVETAVSPGEAATDSPDGQGNPERAFVGLERTISATAYDETFGPVSAEPRVKWRTTNGRVDDGVVTPSRPGSARVTAWAGADEATVRLDVLRKPARITTTEKSVNVPAVDGAATFGVIGFDAHGTSAPIEPSDVTLSYDTSLFSIDADGSRGFRVVPKQDQVAGVVTLEVNGVETSIGVSVGVEKNVLDTFDAPSLWHARATRATAEVTPTPDGEEGAGLTLSYDFTQATATRLAIAELDEPLGVSGQSRSFGMSVKGSGQGEWTAFTFVDAQGDVLPAVYGPYIDWEGWRPIEIAVPEGYPQELYFKRLTIIETQANRQYTGQVVLDNLYVNAAPAVDVPADPAVEDDVVVQDASVGERDWRFAVMSDAQFVASDPDSPQVAGARRSLREIKAAGPDFFVIAGDFVDEASEADFQLAKKILDEEIGDSVPYYYVPGNHEVMGADIANFEKYFGDTRRVFDHRGTRFVTLDTSRGTLLGGGFDQISMLRDALDAAAKDRGVNSLVVVEHHPPRDPTPAKTSQLADRHEAALVEDWLGEFQRATGKGVAFIGAHVGTFHASSVDGVPYVINGNSGKTPATDPADGGFTGWSLWGVDPVSRLEQWLARARPYDGGPDWIGAELRPHVDSLVVSAPSSLEVGTSAELTATVTQGDRDVPVAYPMTSDWSFGRNVFAGDADDARPWHVAAYDPATRTLTALRPGTVEMKVTVNEETEPAKVSLVPR